MGKLVSDFHLKPVFAVVGGLAILLKEAEKEQVLDLVVAANSAIKQMKSNFP